ncbi:MAG: hypothetical protein OEU48_07030, partial [Gammaproteobacteria bacterium]|nr:hypothetical protein [Gammaproteobacteria bacterium]
MKTMFDEKKLGATNRMKVLTFFMLCAICAMAWTFVNVGKQVEQDQARLADVGEQLVLSQRVAKYALAATTGDSDAFNKMEISKNEFGQILGEQMSEFGESTGESKTPESAALIKLDNRWSGFRYNIDAVLEGQFLIMAMSEATSLMSEIMPQLMEHTQGIVSELMKTDASAEQVRLASQQAVLGQRIVNSLNAVMTGQGTESAAVAFAADTREFGRVLDGFMRGTGGITQLKGRTLQSKIQNIALLFSRVSDNVGSIVENAEELVSIQAAAAEITGQSEALFDAASNLKTVLVDGQKGNFVSNELAYFLGAVALLILLFMAYETLIAQRKRSQVVEAENSANQEAIMRLLNEIG